MSLLPLFKEEQRNNFIQLVLRLNDKCPATHNYLRNDPDKLKSLTKALENVENMADLHNWFWMVDCSNVIEDNSLTWKCMNQLIGRKPRNRKHNDI